MINWILIILFVFIILKELKTLKDLVIATRKKSIESLFFLLSVSIIFYIIYLYASLSIHYVVGILATISYAINYFKTGITSKGFVSLQRYSRFIAWNKIQEVHVYKGEKIIVSYFGNGFDSRLYFNIKDYDKIIKFLNTKLPNNLIIIDHYLKS